MVTPFVNDAVDITLTRLFSKQQIDSNVLVVRGNVL